MKLALTVGQRKYKNNRLVNSKNAINKKSKIGRQTISQFFTVNRYL